MLLCLIFYFFLRFTAQIKTRPTVVTKRTPDVSSLRNMKAVYDVISGEAGQKRYWDRFRTLFHPTARMIRQAKIRKPARRRARSTPEEYHALRALWKKKDFSSANAAARHLRQYRAGFLDLRFLSQSRRQKAFRPRHQQFSTSKRRQTLVGCNDLLAKRNAGKSASQRISEKQKKLTAFEEMMN